MHLMLATGIALAAPLALIQADQGYQLQNSTGSVLRPASPTTPEETACAEGGGAETGVEDIRAAGEAMVGRCITTTGWYDGARVYADSDAFYRQNTEMGRFGARIADSRSHQMLLRMTGIVRRCRDEIRVLAACLDSDHYLDVQRWSSADGQRFIRRSLAEAEGVDGNLRPLTDPALIARFTAAADPFFAALHAPDSMALRQLVGRPADASVPDASLIWVAARRLVRLWGDQPLSTIVLGWLPAAEATQEQTASFTAQAAREPEAVVCRATASVAARNAWPIDTRDAGIQDMRPYLCVTISLPEGAAPVYRPTAPVNRMAEP